MNKHPPPPHTHSLTHSQYTQDYQSVVSSLPETDHPYFFDLPANIERSSQRTISSRFISQLKVVTRRGDVEGKFELSSPRFSTCGRN